MMMHLQTTCSVVRVPCREIASARNHETRNTQHALLLMAATNLIPTSALGSLTNELRDIKPPVEIASGWMWLWWTLGVIALAVLAYLIWRWWQKQRDQRDMVPVIPPHVRAKQRLQEALALIGEPRPFCILVSDTLRVYLEERFTFRAPERTTEEFLHELQGTNLLTLDQKTSLADFLQRCDLVKFARYEPGESELRDLHTSALRLVEETEPREEQDAVSASDSSDPQPPSLSESRNREHETHSTHTSRITHQSP